MIRVYSIGRFVLAAAVLLPAFGLAAGSSSESYQVKDEVTAGGNRSDGSQYRAVDTVTYDGSNLFRFPTSGGSIGSNVGEPHPDVTETVILEDPAPAPAATASPAPPPPPPSESSWSVIPGVIGAIGDAIGQAAESIGRATEEFSAGAEALLADPERILVASAVNGVVTGATAAVVGALTLAPLLTGISASAGGLLGTGGGALASVSGTFLSPLNGVFGWVRRRRGYGQVYDLGTRKPIAGATVRLLAFEVPGFERGKLVATMKTDDRGEYRFQVEPGSYRLEVVAADYAFPARHAAVGYRGGPIPAHDHALYPDIPIEGRLGASTIAVEQLRLVASGLNRLRLPLLAAGSLVALTFALGRGSLTDLIILGVYAVLWGIELAGRLSHSGPARVLVQGEPVAMAIARITNETGELIATRATDLLGRFTVFAPPGRYTIAVVTPDGATRQETYVQRGPGDLAPVIRFAA